MLSFLFWLTEDLLNEGRYVYHGTSSNYLDGIKKDGLKPSTGKGTRSKKQTYVTRDPEAAALEAHATVHGDRPTNTKGVGGNPVVLKIDRLHPSFRDKAHKFTIDKAWHKKKHKIHDVHAFHRESGIHPDAIVGVHHAVTVKSGYQPHHGGLGSEYKPEHKHAQCWCSKCQGDD